MTLQEQLNKWRREGHCNLYIEDGIIKHRVLGGESFHPCKVCGDPCFRVNKICDECWEVIGRIEKINKLDIAYNILYILASKIGELQGLQDKAK